MRSAGTAGRRRAGAAPVDLQSPAAADDAAVRILLAAPQSASALRRRLQQRGFPEEVACAAVVAMTARGYVDDAALAGSIAARRQRTGHGRIRVAAELRARGVTEEAITGTLDGVDPEAERAAALALGRRLAERADPSPDPRRRSQRIGAALQRRGFDGDTITWVLRQLEREA